MTNPTHDPHWFRPKPHGYGASPKNWKGWVALAAFALIVVALSFALLPSPGGGAGATPSPGRFGLWITSVLTLSAGFVWLARRKTDGEWRWRWGRGPFIRPK